MRDVAKPKADRPLPPRLNHWIACIEWNTDSQSVHVCRAPPHKRSYGVCDHCHCVLRVGQTDDFIDHQP